MGRSATAFRRSAGDPDRGVWSRAGGAGLYRRPAVMLARSPVVSWAPSARGVPSAGRWGGTLDGR